MSTGTSESIDGKIAITSIGRTLKDLMDPRFGRCDFFLIISLPDRRVETLENAAKYMSNGAGIAAAQNLADRGVKSVITGDVGPKAFAVLRAASIKVFQGKVQSCDSLLSQHLEGGLVEIVGGGAHGRHGRMGRGGGPFWQESRIR